MDGATIHRDPAFLHTLRQRGVVVITLPPYSPWLNPCELRINMVKGDLRRFRGEVLHSVAPVLVPILERRRRLPLRSKIMDAGYGQYCL